MDLYNALVAGGCGTLTATVVNVLYRKITRREEMEGKAHFELQEHRLSTLENESRRHGELLAAVQSLAASVETLSKDIKQMISTDAAQSQAITNLSSYVGNLREDIGELRRDLQQHIMLTMGRPKNGKL